VFNTLENIVYAFVKTGSYFGEMEILKNCHRESIVKTKEHCTFLTMKHQLLRKEIFEKHKDFLKILSDNSNKRNEFYNKVKTFISKIIDNGKIICSINPEILEKLKENPLLNIHNESVKIYFCVGLLQYDHELIIKNQSNRNKKVDVANKVENSNSFMIKKDRTEVKKKLILLEKDQKVINYLRRKYSNL
jgi:hypothetical protein